MQVLQTLIRHAHRELTTQVVVTVALTHPQEPMCPVPARAPTPVAARATTAVVALRAAAQCQVASNSPKHPQRRRPALRVSTHRVRSAMCAWLDTFATQQRPQALCTLPTTPSARLAIRAEPSLVTLTTEPHCPQCPALAQVTIGTLLAATAKFAHQDTRAPPRRRPPLRSALKVGTHRKKATQSALLALLAQNAQ